MAPGKIKRILVGTLSLDRIGGTEVYTYHLLKSLSSRRELEIEYFTLARGMISEKIEKELQIPFKSKKRYDLILANHYPIVRSLFGLGPIIQICHGIFHYLEEPSPFADFHIAISEEIRASLDSKGYRSQVILNGIDVQEFRPFIPVKPEIRTILSLCQGDEANVMLEEICKKSGIHLQKINKFINPILNIQHEINNSDLVVGLGRSIFDAMACGRPCVIFDSRSYNGAIGDGYLHPEKFQEFVINNCSGRHSQRHFSLSDLTNEIQKYNPLDGQRLREIAKTRLNMSIVSKQLVDSCNNINIHTRIYKLRRMAKLGVIKLLNSLKIFSFTERG